MNNGDGDGDDDEDGDDGDDDEEDDDDDDDNDDDLVARETFYFSLLSNNWDLSTHYCLL